MHVGMCVYIHMHIFLVNTYIDMGATAIATLLVTPLENYPPIAEMRTLYTCITRVLFSRS